ncbi:unnamed protein product [Caenorhabditis angaria]|uniref:Uncharacterized protein n=1 Tax=Caenorhabditis angaria TaxID=860376 RepID=A0A9P1IHA5_9PELO|nr:unnamed protein product [Caenorhabditis angaria]
MTSLQQRMLALKKSGKMTMLNRDELENADLSAFRPDDRTNLFDKKSGWGFSNNLTGLIVLTIVLTAVIVIFFGCYLIMRFMHRALSRDDSKDVMRSNNPYNNVVMHSKRVYEIQAEEGCFAGPPDPLDPSDIDDEAEKEPSTSQNSSYYIEDMPAEDNKVKKPESGDLKAMRSSEGAFNDDPRAMLRKKQKVHKDSVCAFLFKPEPEPKMV